MAFMSLSCSYKVMSAISLLSRHRSERSARDTAASEEAQKLKDPECQNQHAILLVGPVVIGQFVLAFPARGQLAQRAETTV